MMRYWSRNVPAYMQIAALRIRLAYTYRTNIAIALAGLL
jgi:hypothetical protein